MLIFAPTNGNFADMVKLVDMPDLGSGAARRVGSSPIIRTKTLAVLQLGFFYKSALPLPNRLKKRINLRIIKPLFRKKWSP